MKSRIELQDLSPKDDALNAQMVHNCADAARVDASQDVLSVAGAKILVHYKGETCSLAVHARVLSDEVIDEAIRSVFVSHSEIKVVFLTECGTNYRNLLIQNHTWIIDMPADIAGLSERIGRKGKYNIKRAEQKLAQELGGELNYQLYDENISPDLVEEYFALKRQTHGTDYGLSPEAYLRRYRVTGAMKLSVGDKMVAVLFYCVNGQTLFLENISYRTDFAKWSPGILLYHRFLEEMVDRRIVRVFLGGGWQPYKERFGSVCYKVYNGRVYRNGMRTVVFSLLNRLRHWYLDRRFGRLYR